MLFDIVPDLFEEDLDEFLNGTSRLPSGGPYKHVSTPKKLTKANIENDPRFDVLSGSVTGHVTEEELWLFTQLWKEHKARQAAAQALISAGSKSDEAAPLTPSSETAAPELSSPPLSAPARTIIPPRSNTGALGGFDLPHQELTRQQQKGSIHLSLFRIPRIPEAETLIDDLSGQIERYEDRNQARARKRRAAVATQFRWAVSAFTGSVLTAWACVPARPVSLSLHRPAFQTVDIGHTTFVAVLDAMLALGYLQQRRGGRSRDGKVGNASRFWPTPMLLTLAVKHGINVGNAKAAFGYRRNTCKARPKVTQPIILRAFPNHPNAQRGPLLTVDPHDPIACILRREVEELNSSAASVRVEGCLPPQWRRQFIGDFRLYGRLHAQGEGNYQGMTPEDRLRNIRIGGEPVVEIDIASSHLSILHGLLRLPLPEGDLYAVAGVPRRIVKAWITATLGKGSPVTKWSSETLQRCPEVADYCAKVVKAAAIARYPFLATVAEVAAEFSHIALANRVLPHLLMGIEAEVIMEVVQALRFKTVLALPMHDGLIVPASIEVEARRLLIEAGERIAGVTLRLDVDRMPPA
ncbi:hypothetical protein [Paracraurococcus lichenis]|uniref:DNA-directed DNA polymerase family A palm domain-containing protein n=1 Tax=Paracraurococcus lichenis TaxID=3064888 RepID=A0ABT9EB70_9PROT|nr:hypothetical protein [Paracraurococcus sp. LOR1-02]MDO9713452.1 hypothetical protein [Paracraurococcus sp. LOR1-02]